MAATPPLSPHVPIADEQGRPTPQFIQWWTEQRGVNNLIIPLTNTSEVSAVLDLLGDTPGAILTRGAAGWQMIVPGAAGEVLTSAGPGVIPAWSSPPSFLSLPDTPADYTGAAGQVATVNSNEDGLVFAPGGGGGGAVGFPITYATFSSSSGGSTSAYAAKGNIFQIMKPSTLWGVQFNSTRTQTIQVVVSEVDEVTPGASYVITDILYAGTPRALASSEVMLEGVGGLVLGVGKFYGITFVRTDAGPTGIVGTGFPSSLPSPDPSGAFAYVACTRNTFDTLSVNDDIFYNTTSNVNQTLLFTVVL